MSDRHFNFCPAISETETALEAFDRTCAAGRWDDAARVIEWATGLPYACCVALAQSCIRRDTKTDAYLKMSALEGLRLISSGHYIADVDRVRAAIEEKVTARR